MQENNPVPTPVVEQPKQSNFLVILLSILLLLSVLIAGFFAFQTQKLVKELTLLRTESTPVATVEPTTEPIATNSPSATADPTVNWKTYVNAKYKYSFKYPISWTVSFEDTYEYSNVTVSSPDEKSVIVTKINNSAKSQDVKNWTKSFPLDNQSYLFVSFAHCAGGPGTGSSCGGAITQEDKTIFDQILSTFKFTN